MYFPDLTPYAYGRTPPTSSVINIGWLSASQPFTRGMSDPRLIDALKLLAASPTNLYRGVHLCEFCPEPPIKMSPGGLPMIDPSPERCGNGEIRVTDSHGITYVAPVLVAHYVAEHDYLPPQQFVDAVLVAAERLDEAQKGKP